MRKLILVAALVLASASAQAAGSGSLTTLTSSDDQATAATEQGKPVDAAKPTEAPKAVDETKPADAPKHVDRPAAANTATDAPTADAVKPAPVQKAERRKPRRDWTEARIIGELHRHGIYW
jgi:hypothetical protein